jgi:two-component system alkaline phosphatase synthesis response regulator PhoP
LSRDELLKRVWGYKAGIATRTVDTHVLTVRKKLGDDAQCPQFIETLHGVGYQFIGEEG